MAFFLHWIVHGGSLIIASKWKIRYRLLFYEEGTATKLSLKVLLPH